MIKFFYSLLLGGAYFLGLLGFVLLWASNYWVIFIFILVIIIGVFKFYK